MFNSDKIIRFEIVTPERVVLKEEIKQVTIPTEEGELTVLPNHMPLVSIIKPGVIELTNQTGEIKIMSVAGGFLEVLRNKVVILADSAERAEEIDAIRCEEARCRAEETLKDLRQFDRERYVSISATITKELAKISAYEKWKRVKK